MHKYLILISISIYIDTSFEFKIRLAEYTLKCNLRKSEVTKRQLDV